MLLSDRPDQPTFYRNITISGLPGVGTTTLLRNLKVALEPHGWTGYSGGEYLRRFAPEPIQDGKAHHAATDYDPAVDRENDMRMRDELTTQENLIIESWLSGFFAQGIPHVLKILVICSSDIDRAARLSQRDGMSPKKAIVKAFKRTRKNLGRWAELYAQEWQDWVVAPGLLDADRPIFFWNPRLYDLVIDTAAYNEQECLEIVLEALRNSDPVTQPG